MPPFKERTEEDRVEGIVGEHNEDLDRSPVSKLISIIELYRGSQDFEWIEREIIKFIDELHKEDVSDEELFELTKRAYYQATNKHGDFGNAFNDVYLVLLHEIEKSNLTLEKFDVFDGEDYGEDTL